MAARYGDCYICGQQVSSEPDLITTEKLFSIAINDKHAWIWCTSCLGHIGEEVDKMREASQ